MCNNCHNHNCSCVPCPVQVTTINNYPQGNDGESAYEIAIRTGQFVGTEQEWIASLEGPQGPAGQGIPTGGTAGQVLAKIDSTNYNTQWTTPSGGGTVTADKGLTKTGNNIQLGGEIPTGDFIVIGGSNTARVYLAHSGEASFGTNVGGFNFVGLQTSASLGAIIEDTILNKGAGDAADYSANKTEFSYVTKQMLEAALGSGLIFNNGLLKSGNTVGLGGNGNWATTNASIQLYSTFGGQIVYTNPATDNTSSVTAGKDFTDNSNIAAMGIGTPSGGISVNTSSALGAYVQDQVFERGLGDDADYSANKTQFSYVTKQMLEDATGGGASGFVELSPTAPQTGFINIEETGTGGAMPPGTTGELLVGADGFSYQQKQLTIGGFKNRILSIIANLTGFALSDTNDDANGSVSVGLSGASISGLNKITNLRKRISVDINAGMTVTDEIDQIGLGDIADYSPNKTQFSYVTKKMLDESILLGGYGTHIKDGKINIGLDPTTIGTTNDGLLVGNTLLVTGDITGGAYSSINVDSYIISDSVNSTSTDYSAHQTSYDVSSGHKSIITSVVNSPTSQNSSKVETLTKSDGINTLSITTSNQNGSEGTGVNRVMSININNSNTLADTRLHVIDDRRLRGLGDFADYSANKQAFDYVTKQMLDQYVFNGDYTGNISIGNGTTNGTLFLGASVANMARANSGGGFNGLTAHSDYLSLSVDVSGGLTKKIQLGTNFMTITDSIDSKGIRYAADYSPNWTSPDDDHILVTKKYVDDNAGGGGGVASGQGITVASGLVNLGGDTADSNTAIIGAINTTYKSYLVLLNTTAATATLDTTSAIGVGKLVGAGTVGAGAGITNQGNPDTKHYISSIISKKDGGTSRSIVVSNTDSPIGITIIDSIGNKGAYYGADYAGSWTSPADDLVLVNKKYVDDKVLVTASNGLTKSSGDIKLGGDYSTPIMVGDSIKGSLTLSPTAATLGGVISAATPNPYFFQLGGGTDATDSTKSVSYMTVVDTATTSSLTIKVSGLSGAKVEDNIFNRGLGDADDYSPYKQDNDYATVKMLQYPFTYALTGDDALTTYNVSWFDVLNRFGRTWPSGQIPKDFIATSQNTNGGYTVFSEDGANLVVKTTTPIGSANTIKITGTVFSFADPLP